MRKFKLSLTKSALKKISLTLSLALTLTITELPFAKSVHAEETTSTSSETTVTNIEMGKDYTFNKVTKVEFTTNDTLLGQLVGKIKLDKSQLVDVNVKNLMADGLKIILEEAETQKTVFSYIINRPENHIGLFSCMKDKVYNVKLVCYGSSKSGSVTLNFSAKDFAKTPLPTNEEPIELENASRKGFVYVAPKTGIYQLSDTNHAKCNYSIFAVPTTEATTQAPTSQETASSLSTTSKILNINKELFLEKDTKYLFIFEGTDLRKTILKPKLEYICSGVDTFTIKCKNNLSCIIDDINDLQFDVNITYKEETSQLPNINKIMTLEEIQQMGINVDFIYDVDISEQINYTQIIFSSVLSMFGAESYEQLMSMLKNRNTKGAKFIYLNKETTDYFTITKLYDYVKKHAKSINIGKTFTHSYDNSNNNCYSFTGKTGAYQLCSTLNSMDCDATTLCIIFDEKGNVINFNFLSKEHDDASTFYLKNGKKYYMYYVYYSPSYIMFSSLQKYSIQKGKENLHIVSNPKIRIIESVSHKHVAVTDKGRAATYTHTGLTAGSHCKLCGKVLKKQTVIPKKIIPKLNKTTLTIKKGKTFALKMLGIASKVTWSTSNKKIAKVSSLGIVTGLKKGKTTINAKYAGKKYKCIVTVK